MHVCTYVRMYALLAYSQVHTCMAHVQGAYGPKRVSAVYMHMCMYMYM